MKKTIKLTESDLKRIIQRVIRENQSSPGNNPEILAAIKDYGFEKKNCENYQENTDKLSHQFCHSMNPKLIILYDSQGGLELLDTASEEILGSWDNFMVEDLVDLEGLLKTKSINEAEEMSSEDCGKAQKQVDMLSKIATRAIMMLPSKMKNVVEKSFNTALNSGDETALINSLPSNIKSEFEKKKNEIMSNVKSLPDAQKMLDDVAKEDLQEQGTPNYLGFVGPTIRVIQIIGLLVLLLKWFGIIKKKNPTCNVIWT